MRDFVATVLADTEDTWSQIFTQSGQDYPEPTLTLFSGGVSSACGFASSATGPFYCPGDQNLYIDLDFYDELRRRFGAPGDFAQAYVLAHEVGHHVQNVLGMLEADARARAKRAMSVRTELQADCFAGIWANHTNQRGLLEEGDVEEAMTAAAAVGDDAHPEPDAGLCRARELHPRNLGAAHDLVPPRLRERLGRPVQHVRGGVSKWRRIGGVATLRGRASATRPTAS